MPSCYRHPARDVNVACSRCARPICPDCMISTPVGMRCPECASDRTQVRRVAPGGFGQGAEPATYVLIGLNAVAFLGEVLAGGSGAASIGGGGSLIQDGGLNAFAIDVGGEWWRIVTSGFLHAGPLHLLLNMFALYILGSMLEPAVGTARFVAIYVVSMLAGACGALILDPNELTVGASGAVFGLMSAAFVMARRRGMEDLASQIGLYVVINLVFTFSVPNISVGGHVGGLVGGALAALLIAWFERSRIQNRLPIEIGLMAGLAVIAVVGCLLAAASGVPEQFQSLGVQ
ncbi:MAG: rhomboid family intramembrane serine protease [Solirubrobacterales bacterium]